jgi:hypothetical protein
MVFECNEQVSYSKISSLCVTGHVLRRRFSIITLFACHCKLSGDLANTSTKRHLFFDIADKQGKE